MGTHQSKHLVSRNIGLNIQIFCLPRMAIYLVKEHVEVWGLEVVEGTTQNTMKIRSVYVVNGKTTTPSFVEMVDIKKYNDDFVLLNTHESSTFKIYCGTSCEISLYPLLICVMKKWQNCYQAIAHDMT